MKQLSKEDQDLIVKVYTIKDRIEMDSGLKAVNVSLSSDLWGTPEDHYSYLMGLPVILDAEAPKGSVAVGVRR
jgi:hypothetical protein